MNLKIINEKDEPLLSRKEVTAELYFEKAATPSNDKVKKNISSQLKADEKLIVIKKIDSHYGTTEAVVTAVVYTSKEEMEKIEPKKKEKKEKKPKAEKPAPEKKEEKKEEAAEEKPAEEKKEGE